MRQVFAGRRVILAGAVAAAWTEHIALLRSVGVSEMMVYATEGRGAGPGPDLPTVVVEPPAGSTMMESIHFGNAALADPDPTVLAGLDEFDPDGDALVVGTFLGTTPRLAGREVLAHRRPEWVALEDKVVVDAFWDRAGVAHQPAMVVSREGATDAAATLDRGDGTVWAADAREGFHGGGTQTYWVTDANSAEHAKAGLAPVCDHVRIMPFIEGVPCSIHGIVLPDGIVVLRPVEMIVLRSKRQGFPEFVYAGCATYWDPPGPIREQMRDVARRVGRQLADEVGFRGTFTVDGVAAHDGFWPTELNPRFGAGINAIARAADLPLLLLNDLIVGGHSIGRSASEIEEELVERADARRGGGTWKAGPAVGAEFIGREARYDSTVGWRWSLADEVSNGSVTAGTRFLRCIYDPATTPAGPSTGSRAVAFWNFADREFETGLGLLNPAADPWG